MAKRKTAKAGSKTAFVLAQPEAQAANDVVAAAKAAGIAITRNQVNQIRSDARTKRSKRRVKKAAAAPAPQTRATDRRVGNDVHSRFVLAAVAVILEGGKPLAEKLLRAAEERIRDAARG